MRFHLIRRILRFLLICLVILFVVGYGFVYFSEKNSVHDIASADLIVVLGDSLEGSELSESTKLALDAAYKAYQEGMGEKILVCGSLHAGEYRLQSDVMSDYLEEKGMASRFIRQDSLSRNQAEALKCLAIEQSQTGESMILICMDTQSFRLKQLANRYGVNLQVYPTHEGYSDKWLDRAKEVWNLVTLLFSK